MSHQCEYGVRETPSESCPVCQEFFVAGGGTTYEGYTFELIEAAILKGPSTDPFWVTVQREEWEGLQRWLCQITNLKTGERMVLKDGKTRLIAFTWGAAEAWWKRTTEGAAR